MQKISDTFCPAKWDEVYVSYEMNYAYACCKSRPTEFHENPLEYIDKERSALLDGLQDTSCEYCWRLERAGQTSLRHEYLKKFDEKNFESYANNTQQPKFVQVSIGNECNFQCTYCNPKFSSKWEEDVSKQKYKIFTDRFFYEVKDKQKDVVDKSIAYLQTFDNLEQLSVLGGEPLLNKKFFQLIDSVESKLLQLVTNLSVSQSTIDRLFEKAHRFERVDLLVSLDATGHVAEFTRYGLDFEKFDRNLNYIINNKPDNVVLVVHSLMTSITIQDIKNLKNYLWDKLDKIEWTLTYCKDPRIQSLETLSDAKREHITTVLDQLRSHSKINGVDPVINAVKITRFNHTLYNELQNFLHEFSQRKQIEIPCLN